MRSRFPKVEVPAFEPHYGKAKLQAPSNLITYNLNNSNKTNLGNVIVPHYDFDFVSKKEQHNFSENLFEYKKTRNLILNFYSTKKRRIKVKEILEDAKSEVLFVLKVFSFLENQLLINVESKAVLNEVLNEMQNEVRAEPRNEGNNEVRQELSGEVHFEVRQEPRAVLQNIARQEPRAVLQSQTSLESKFCNGCGSILSDDFLVNFKEYFFMCFLCFKKGNFSGNSKDFLRIENFKDYFFSEKEEILLFEAVENKKSWNFIAEKLNKKKEICILHFLRANIKIDTLKTSTDFEGGSLSLVFNNLPNPIIAFISFLSSNLNPKIGAKIAKYFLTFENSENCINKKILKLSIFETKKQKKIEIEKEKKLKKILKNLLIKKMNLKLNEFEEILKNNEKEKNQFEIIKENYLKEYKEIKNSTNQSVQ